MELRHLRAFLAVAEDLHFGRAAERLGLAAPSLTVQIQTLERQVGAVLFQRTKRRVALTAAGQSLVPEARHLLDLAERAAHTARRAGRGEIGRVVVGYVATAALSGVLRDVLDAFRRSRPDVALELEEMSASAQIIALADGRLDAAFIRPPFRDPDGIVTMVARREAIVAAIPASHPLARRRRISRADLADQHLIAPSAEDPSEFQTLAQRLGEARTLAPVIAYRAHDMLTVLTYVGAGLGLSLVPDSARLLPMPGVVYRPLADMQETSQLVIAHRRDERQPAALALVATARAYCRAAGKGAVAADGRATIGGPA